MCDYARSKDNGPNLVVKPSVTYFNKYLKERNLNNYGIITLELFVDTTSCLEAFRASSGV